MSAVLAHPMLSPPWRQALPAFGLLVLALLLLYRDTAIAMVGIWARSETFAHAFLVPPIALWLAWRRRHLVAVLAPQPQPWMLLPMAAAMLGWLLGDLAGVNSATQLMFTVLLVLAVPAMLGLAVARELAFSLAFLFFMVPIGEFMLPTLMEGTADFTVWALTLSGVPVYREGLQFIIPSGAWSVVEACSGVRYLIASFMVGTLFAYLNYRSMKRRLIFCGVALLMPILANWLRAYMIVMLGHFSGNTIAVGVDHLIYGWVFFGIVIGLMFFIGSRWSEPAADEPPAATGGHAATARSAGPAAHWVMAAAAVLVLALPQAALWQLERAGGGAAPLLALPDLPGTGPAPAEATLLTPIFQGPAAVASRTYGVSPISPISPISPAGGPRAVTVHVAYYRQQHYGHKLVSSENMLVKSEDRQWNRSASGGMELALGERQLALRWAELLGGGIPGRAGRQRLEVRQLLWVDGHFTASDPWATALGVRGRLAGRGDDGAAITFYTAGEASEGTAELLDGFVRTHLGTLEAQLAAVRAAR